MFDTINGIPVHPLVVHGVVVLLPLAVLGTLLIAVRPQWRTRYGPLVVAAALVATVLCPVATSSGEELERRVGEPEAHAELGEQLVWFSLALLVLSTALVLLQRQRERPTGAPVGGRGGTLLTAVAALAVVAAVASGVEVYRVGDSGARAAWGDASGEVSAPLVLSP